MLGHDAQLPAITYNHFGTYIHMYHGSGNDFTDLRIYPPPSPSSRLGPRHGPPNQVTAGKAVSGPSLRYMETSRPTTVFHARRRAYPPCHSLHDHRWGQRCACDCGFGLTSRPLACSCTLPGAILEPPGGLGRSLAVCALLGVANSVRRQ